MRERSIDPFPLGELRDDIALDARLVESALKGESEAFEQLLRRHEGRVLRLLRLLGVAPEDREDVAQEVFIRVFRHLGGFHRGRPFAAWLYRITVNTANTQRRRIARHRREETAPVERLHEAPDRRPGPGAVLEGRERQRRLEAALAALSDRERAVFVLCELEALETRQVAAALGITRITVRRHLGRARARLRELLAADPG